MSKALRSAILVFSKRNRLTKARRISAFITRRGYENAILVGCSPGTNSNERVVEDAVEAIVEILASCDVLMSPTSTRFVLGDGRALPFRSQAADIIIANAVIEHVGDEDDQKRFVAEQTRVANGWVITTPNRWFPIEAHTSVFFRHWSVAWRANRSEFTRLLSRREFAELLPLGTEIVGRVWSPTFTAFYHRQGQ